MYNSRLVLAIPGLGHYIEECLDFLLTLVNVDLYLSQSVEEAKKMYRFNVNNISDEMLMYRMFSIVYLCDIALEIEITTLGIK
jgi:dihydromethanopterin reductase (acceptor)